MDDDKAHAVKKSTVTNERMKVAANDPALRGKIRIDDIAEGEPVHWYIRFNLPLDPASVNRSTMYVMEQNGYILTSIFSYDEADNTIIISPVDPYLQNEFYIMTITTAVRSAKGNNMKRDVHVLFKLIDNKISEFRILESTAKVPKPRVKPESEKRKTALAVSKYYSFMDTAGKRDLAVLPAMPMKVNPWLGLLGAAAFFAGLFVGHMYVLAAASALCVAGMSHIVLQLAKRELRSAIMYNIGAMLFNAGKHKAAAKRFRAAHLLDEANEYAEYAVGKVKFYE